MNAIAVTASHWPNGHTLVLERTLKLLNVANMGLLAVTARLTFTVFSLDLERSLPVYRRSAFRGTLLPLMPPSSFCQQTLLLCTFKAPASPFPCLLGYHGLSSPH